MDCSPDPSANAGADKNVSTVGPASESAFWYGLGGVGLERIPGQVSFTNSKGIFLNHYANWPQGNGAVRTYTIGNIGKVISRSAVPLAIGIDAIGVMTGDVSYGKAATNAGFAAYGYYANPFLGTAYFSIDLFYPGGWPQALSDRQAILLENSALGFPARTSGWGE